MDDKEATLDSQFLEFTKLLDSKRDGTTITLTVPTTGLLDASKKTELTFDEWHEFLTDLCTYKGVDQEVVETALTNCGIPDTSPVVVPKYREFFNSYKPISPRRRCWLCSDVLPLY